MLISEIVLMNPRLTQNQQVVLCVTFNAPTSTVAVEQTQQTDNMVEARKQLFNMGMIEYDNDGGIVITDDGKSAMRREDLLDETDSLTERGASLVRDYTSVTKI